MINAKEKKLSIRQQCSLIGLHRSTYYFKAKDLTLEDLQIMRQIDEIFTEQPCYGTRRPSSKMKCNTVDCLLKNIETKNGVANENIPANRHGRKRKNSESFAIAVFNNGDCKSSWAV